MATRNIRKAALTEAEIRNQQFIGSMNLIMEKEPEMAQAIQETVMHIGKTYSDKYANSPLETKGLIYWPDDKGKGYNIGNAARYIQRYLTDGFNKSDNPTDIKKCLHYVLFELTRLIKIDAIESKAKDIVE